MYNHQEVKVAHHLPVLQCAFGTFAEISLSVLLFLPSMLFGRSWTVRPSTQINPVLMSVPAALSLVQDLVFYYALLHVASSQETLIASRSLALPIALLLSRLIISKVFTTGMVVSVAIIFGGTALEFS